MMRNRSSLMADREGFNNANLAFLPFFYYFYFYFYILFFYFFTNPVEESLSLSVEVLLTQFTSIPFFLRVFLKERKEYFI